MDEKKIREAIEKAIKKAKKRNFKQSVDMAINLKDVDLKDPSARIDIEVPLPKGRGKDINIGVFADGEMALEAESLNAKAIRREDIEKLVKNRRDAKKMAKKIDIFLAQADMMPLIGRRLGAILGPRGKMPKPVPPVGNIKQFIDRAKNVVRVRTKDKPVIHCSIGVEDMNVEDLTANAISVISAVAYNLPRGEHNINSIYLKLTMGPAVKV